MNLSQRRCPLKLVIAGGRNFNLPTSFIHAACLHFNLNPTLIIQGEANGVDASAKRYALEQALPQQGVKADWTANGRAAGPMRNAEMALLGEALLLIWNGQSVGSASMRREMLKRNKPVYEIVLRETNTQQTILKV
jgi:hypothetical protein